jgi:hypothetical protein
MLPGRIIGGSDLHTDRLLLDDEPVLDTLSASQAVQPIVVTVPTPPRDGGRSGIRDPRSDIFGMIPSFHFNRNDVLLDC